MILDQRSLKNLEGVHSDLAKVIAKAAELLTDYSFVVTEGSRTVERQKELLAQKKTTTMKSRHIPENNACGKSCAVDLAVKVGKTVVWDMEAYRKLSLVVKEAAKQVGIPIEWGGDWKSFKDGPHFQLPKLKYPEV